MIYLIGGSPRSGKTTLAKATFNVGRMVAKYSNYFEKEAKKTGLKILNMDIGFMKQIQDGIRYLAR